MPPCCYPIAAPLQVAIKKVLQDKRFKNRELQIIRMMNHPNIVQLKHCFYTTTEKDEVRAAGVVCSGAAAALESAGQLRKHCAVHAHHIRAVRCRRRRPTGVPEPGAGVRARHGVPHQQALHQE